MKTYKLTIEVEPTESEALRLQRMARADGVSSKQKSAEMVKQAVAYHYDQVGYADFADLMAKHIYGGVRA